jgi:hypothetical protein
MMFPQVYLGAGLIGLLMMGGLYLKGRIDGRTACNDRIAVMAAESMERERNAQQQALEASAQLEAARGKTAIKYKTIVKEVEKVVERPVYSNLCLDDDGLRLVNAALTGSATAAGQPVDTLPHPAGPGRR